MAGKAVTTSQADKAKPSRSRSRTTSKRKPATRKRSEPRTAIESGDISQAQEDFSREYGEHG